METEMEMEMEIDGSYWLTCRNRRFVVDAVLVTMWFGCCCSERAAVLVVVME